MLRYAILSTVTALAGLAVATSVSAEVAAKLQVLSAPRHEPPPDQFVKWKPALPPAGGSGLAVIVMVSPKLTTQLVPATLQVAPGLASPTMTVPPVPAVAATVN